MRTRLDDVQTLKANRQTIDKHPNLILLTTKQRKPLHTVPKYKPTAASPPPVRTSDLSLWFCWERRADDLQSIRYFLVTPVIKLTGRRTRKSS
jgi:hypothetical protein